MPDLTRRLLAAVATAGLVGLVGIGAAALGVGPAAADPTSGPPVGGARLVGSAVTYDVPAGVPAPPRMPAKGYLLADLTTGQILVAKDPHGRFLPASTLKILTALTLLPRLDPHATYRARKADEVVDGTRVGIAAGSTYTVHKLFQGLLMSSGNDAANALANAGGGVPRTVDLMQHEADHLGARDTTVGDPSGLDSPGQRTSAYDLALFSRAAMRRKDFRDLVATRTTTFPGMVVHGRRTHSFQIQNHNELLGAYRGAIGIKPGYTEAARWTYVGAARRGSHTYLVSEMSLSRQGWSPTRGLLTWAFRHGSQARPVGRLVDPGEVTAPAASAGSAGTVAAGPASAAELSTDPSGGSHRRWVGVVGLGAAALIVGGLGLSAARRRA